MIGKKKIFSFGAALLLAAGIGAGANASLEGTDGQDFVLDDAAYTAIALKVKTDLQSEIDAINLNLSSLTGNQTTNTNTLNSMKVPPGMIGAFAGSIANIPEGYLACNGQIVSKITYPKLWIAIGDTYKNQINPSTRVAYNTVLATNEFRLPNFQGMFLRGLGNTSIGNSASLGFLQEDETAKNSLLGSSTSFTGSGNTGAGSAHNHGISGLTVSGSNSSSSVSITTNLVTNFSGPSSADNGAQSAGNTNGRLITGSGTANAQAWSGSIGGGSISSESAHTHSVSVTGTLVPLLTNGYSETIPQNFGVNYIIKVD